MRPFVKPTLTVTSKGSLKSPHEETEELRGGATGQVHPAELGLELRLSAWLRSLNKMGDGDRESPPGLPEPPFQGLDLAPGDSARTPRGPALKEPAPPVQKLPSGSLVLPSSPAPASFWGSLPKRGRSDGVGRPGSLWAAAFCFPNVSGGRTGQPAQVPAVLGIYQSVPHPITSSSCQEDLSLLLGCNKKAEHIFRPKQQAAEEKSPEEEAEAQGPSPP